MSTGQTTQPQAETSVPAPVAGTPPPDAVPEAVAEVRNALASLVRTQCELVNAAAGVVYLAAGSARRPGLAAEYRRTQDVVDGADIERAWAQLLPRLEASASAVARGAEGGDLATIGAGRTELVPVPRRDALYGEESRVQVLASPLIAEGRVEGVCVLVLGPRARVEAREALRVMSAAASAFEAFLWRKQAHAEAEQRLILRQALEVLDAAQQGEDAGTFASILCQELKRRFGGVRASVGLFTRDRLSLAAVSGTDELDKRGAAAESLEAAMEECAAQDLEIVYPPPEAQERDPAQRRVTRAHAELSRRFGPSTILSLPLHAQGDLVGVVTIEREAQDPFSPSAAALVKLMAEFVGPSLWTRRLADRGIFAVTRDRVLELGTLIVGPTHTAWKLVGLLILLVFAGLLVPLPDRVSAPAEARAEASRAIMPPFPGYLGAVHVKPGDVVEAGQVLAEMETGQLELEAAQARARLASVETQRDDALSKGELAQARSLGAQARELEAALSLLQDNLARAAVRSPMAGVVSRGELEPLVGARVEPSQALVEVVSQDIVVRARVDERVVHRVRPGQRGTLAPKARPGERLEVEVTRVSPSAEAEQGGNVYVVELALRDADARTRELLRPGMTGIVRLRDGWTPGIARLLGPAADELRLRLWW